MTYFKTINIKKTGCQILTGPVLDWTHIISAN